MKGQPLISLNEKYASYHNLMQRCSDFGFVPNIAISTMENTLIYRFCNKKLGIGIDADIHKDNTIPEGMQYRGKYHCYTVISTVTKILFPN